MEVRSDSISLVSEVFSGKWGGFYIHAKTHLFEPMKITAKSYAASCVYCYILFYLENVYFWGEEEGEL